jgi:Tetratricopeptide repeat/Fibronectin type III domain
MAGVSAPTHLATVVQNARALRERGDLAGARTVLAEALVLAGAAYGHDHPDVLHTARLLAAVHRETGALTDARRTIEEALNAGQLSRAEDEPVMLLLTYDLGLIADELGNRHEARRNLGLVARLGPAALGEGHPAVQAAAAYLAPVDEDAAPPPPATPHSTPTAEPRTLPRATPHSTPAAEPRTAPRATPHSTPAAEPRPTSPVGPVPPRVEPIGREPRSGRTPMVLIIGAVLVVAVLVVAIGALALRRPSRPAARPAPTETASVEPLRPAPTAVRLRDEGSTITVTWTDLSGGTTPFIVSVARAGEQARPFANLPVGTTTYTVNGLNPRLEYCLTVVAVYSTEVFAASDLVCTRRTSPAPSRTS